MPRKKSELRLQLGPWIRYRGLTQHQVAKDAGVGDSYLTQLINNPAREPSVTVLFAFAEALGIENPKDLFREPPPVKLSGAGQSEFAPADHSEVRAMSGETNAAPKQKLSRALAAKRISRARAKLDEVLHALGDARNELIRNDEEEPEEIDPGLFRSNAACGDRTRRADRCSVGAAVTAAEERPEPIVQTNFEHLNLAARRESVSPERPRSKREVIQFEKVIFKLRRPISP